MATSLSETGLPEGGPRNGTGVARERELMARIARQDRRAFEEVYNLYHRRLARCLTRLTHRYDLAEEIINDTLWVVWRRARDFRGDSQPSTWIMGIAYRKKKKKKKKGAQRLPAPLLPARASSSKGLAALPGADEVGAATQAAELRDGLGRALERLPVEQRMAVELCYELGFSCEEIAVIMGCPTNTVKTRLFHARAKLQKLLPELSGRPPGGDGRPEQEIDAS